MSAPSPPRFPQSSKDTRTKERVKVMHETYRCTRNLQSSLNSVQKELLQLQKSMLKLSNTLSLQSSTYTDEEDEEMGGIVYNTKTASEYARYNAEILRNLSSVINATVSGIDQTAKRFAVTVMSGKSESQEDVKCSVIKCPVAELSRSQVQVESNKNTVEAFVDLRETVRNCIKGLTEVSKAIEVHRGDAFNFLHMPDPFPHQADNVLSSLKEECIALNKSLQENERICGEIVRMNPLKKNDKIRQGLATALRKANDSSILTLVRRFITELQQSKSVEDICMHVKGFVNCGTNADELLSYPSFPDMIKVIENYEEELDLTDFEAFATLIEPKSEEDGPTQLRIGTLRLSKLESVLLKQLEASEDIREALVPAKQIPELVEAMHGCTSLETLLDSPSIFVHNLMELLNTIRLSSRDPETGIENTEAVIVEQAFKQFVMLYDRQHQLFSDLHEARKVCFDNGLPDTIPVLGRKYLFHASVEYFGATKKQVPYEKLKREPLKNSMLSNKKQKLVMYVFSDMIYFQNGDRIEEWRMTQVRGVERSKKNKDRDSKTVFFIKRYNGNEKNEFCYYFKVRGSDMEDADMPVVVDRIKCALESYGNKNISTKSFKSLCADNYLSCDGIPRQFIHAVAWIIANDMKVSGPFREPPSDEELTKQRILTENGYFPLYTSKIPESLLKHWLKRIEGATIEFKDEDWAMSEADEKNKAMVLATKLNTLLKPEQLKMFALMVALAHCVVRHNDRTEFKNSTDISPVFGGSLFHSRKDRDSSKNKQTMLAVTLGANRKNSVFADIFDATDDPASFRSLFYSIFPGANPPSDKKMVKKPASSASVSSPSTKPASKASVALPSTEKKVNTFQSFARSSRSSRPAPAAGLGRTPQPVVPGLFPSLPSKRLVFNVATVTVMKPPEPAMPPKPNEDDDENYGSDDDEFSFLNDW